MKTFGCFRESVARGDASLPSPLFHRPHPRIARLPPQNVTAPRRSDCGRRIGVRARARVLPDRWQQPAKPFGTGRGCARTPSPAPQRAPHRARAPQRGRAPDYGTQGREGLQHHPVAVRRRQWQSKAAGGDVSLPGACRQKLVGSAEGLRDRGRGTQPEHERAPRKWCANTRAHTHTRTHTHTHTHR